MAWGAQPHDFDLMDTTTPKQTGGYVHPQTAFINPNGEVAFACNYADVGGIELRAYAAIHLKVPDSGIDWLDAMIAKSQLREMTAAALSGALAHHDFGDNHHQRSDYEFKRHAA